MKILFQGDSITDAFRKPDELNTAFQLGNGYAFLVASRLAEKFPDRNWQFFNRGISGHGVKALRRRWEADALELCPDILSLLIGVNDTLQFQRGTSQLSDDEFALNYAWLVDSLLAANQKMKMILLEPFLLPVGEVTDDWSQHLLARQRFVRDYAARKGAVFLPLQTILDDACHRAPAAYWAYDGIHPTHAGFSLIADAWLAAASPLLGVKS